MILIAVSQPMSIQLHRSPKKLWRSNSIFNLWVQSSFAVVLFGCFPPSLPSVEAAFSLPSLVVFLLSVYEVNARVHSPEGGEEGGPQSDDRKKPGILPFHFFLGSEIGHYTGSGATISKTKFLNVQFR
jgi:hypothetical protein